MKAGEIRELSSEEIRQKLGESVEALFNLRFQHATDQLENPMRMRQVKEDIARMETILREREITSSSEA
jgi:large subunit ribosomal protein L29